MSYLKLFKTNKNYLGFGFLHYFFSLPGQTIIINLFVPGINEALGITNHEFGLLYSFATLSSALLIPYFGKFIDSKPLRLVSVLNGVMLCIFLGLLSFTNHWIVLFVGLFGLRICGQGMMALIASTAIARHFNALRGKALSISALGLSFGEAILPFTVVALIGSLNWMVSLQILGLGVLLIFIPLSILSIATNDPFQLPPVEETSNDNTIVHSKKRKEIVGKVSFNLLLIYAILPAFILTGLFLHQNLLIVNKGWTMELIAKALVGFGLIKILTYFISGPLIDHFTAKKIFAFTMIPLIIGITFLLLFQGKWVAYFYLIAAGVTAGINGVAGSSLWAELYGGRHLGAIRSYISAFFIGATSIGALIFSWLMTSIRIMEITLLASIIFMTLMSFLVHFVLSKKEWI